MRTELNWKLLLLLTYYLKFGNPHYKNLFKLVCSYLLKFLYSVYGKDMLRVHKSGFRRRKLSPILIYIPAFVRKMWVKWDPLILLTCRIGWVPNNANKWQMGLNSAFKGLRKGDSHIKHNSLTSTIPWLTPTRALSPSHTRPWPPCRSLPSTTCFCTRARPHSVTFLPTGSGYFRAKPFPI